MLFDLFSKRRKKERGDFPDVYQYEEIPNQFRVQVVHMLQEAFAREGKHFTGDALEVIKEWGFTYKTVAFTWVKQNRKTERVNRLWRV